MLIESLEPRQLFDAGPTVSLKIAPKSPNASTGSLQLLVTYSDHGGVNAQSIDSRDLRITGPNSFARYALPITSKVNADGTVRTIQYKLSPPGGTWNSTDNGKYTVKLRGQAVSDLQGNFTPPRTLGTFSVNIKPASGAAPANPRSVQSHLFSAQPLAADRTADDVLTDLQSL